MKRRSFVKSSILGSILFTILPSFVLKPFNEKYDPDYWTLYKPTDGPFIATCTTDRYGRIKRNYITRTNSTDSTGEYIDFLGKIHRRFLGTDDNLFMKINESVKKRMITTPNYLRNCCYSTRLWEDCKIR